MDDEKIQPEEHPESDLPDDAASPEPQAEGQGGGDGNGQAAAAAVPVEAEDTKKWFIVHTYSGFEQKVAESLRRAVAGAGPAGLDVTCSFGVATTGGPHADADALLAQADTALYEAKRLGRNRVCHAREMLLTPVA